MYYCLHHSVEVLETYKGWVNCWESNNQKIGICNQFFVTQKPRTVLITRRHCSVPGTLPGTKEATRKCVIEACFLGQLLITGHKDFPHPSQKCLHDLNTLNQHNAWKKIWYMISCIIIYNTLINKLTLLLATFKKLYLKYLDNFYHVFY